MADWNENLTLPVWNSLSNEERADQARAISEKSAARFSKLADFKRGNQMCSVALFSKDNSTFALIPGGDVELGYRQGLIVDLPQDEKDEWLEYLQDCNAVSKDETIDDYLKRILTQQRKVTLRPFLIEVKPVGAERYYEDAEDNEDSSCHQLIRNALEQKGYVLPSSDQWEWACSGDSRELFPWGRTPIRGEEIEAQIGAGLIDPKPNAFGLHLNLDPYNCECTDTEMIMRAGDGGTRVCGGAYDTFISQASAYFEDISDTDAVAEYYEAALVRRVIPL